MTIGKMRHYVAIYQQTETADGLGGATLTNSKVLDTFASIKHKTLKGAIGPGGQIADRTQIDFVIRQLGAETVRQGMFVEFDSREMYIEAVANEDELGRFLRLVTAERETG